MFFRLWGHERQLSLLTYKTTLSLGLSPSQIVRQSKTERRWTRINRKWKAFIMYYYRSWSPSTAWSTLFHSTSTATAWTGIPQTTSLLWIMSSLGKFIRTARYILVSCGHSSFDVMTKITSRPWLGGVKVTLLRQYSPCKAINSRLFSDPGGWQMQCLRHCCVWGASKDRADLVATPLCPGVLGRRATQGPQGGCRDQEELSLTAST